MIGVLSTATDEALRAAAVFPALGKPMTGGLFDMAGLKPTSKGAKLRYRAGQLKAVAGAFAEAKEVIAGYWILNVKSKAEAIEWVKRFPFEAGGPQEGEGEVEIREFYEPSELPRESS